MTTNVTFIAEASALSNSDVRLSHGCTSGLITRAVECNLAKLWFAAYPPEIATELSEAHQAIRDMFNGEYGPFWPEASPLIFSGSELIAAICTVVKALWEKTPTFPFIIDLMVHPGFRKHGFATFLLQERPKWFCVTGKPMRHYEYWSTTHQRSRYTGNWVL